MSTSFWNPILWNWCRYGRTGLITVRRLLQFSGISKRCLLLNPQPRSYTSEDQRTSQHTSVRNMRSFVYNPLFGLFSPSFLLQCLQSDCNNSIWVMKLWFKKKKKWSHLFIRQAKMLFRIYKRRLARHLQHARVLWTINSMSAMYCQSFEADKKMLS